MPWPPQSAAQISVGDRDIERDKKESGGNTDRKEGRGGVVVWMEREDKAVTGQGNKGEEKTNPGVIVGKRRPRSTTLSDGS